jgi:uncharacterized protein
LRINGRKEATSMKTIWIDLDNTPHVPFFNPIIQELEKRGYRILLSARDCFQVCELADKYQMKYVTIGRHYGKNKAMKVLGLMFRALQFIPILMREKPDVAVSHGSRSQIIISRLFKIPSIALFDYEYARKLVPPNLVMAPELIPDDVIREIGFERECVLRYPGLKEDLHVPRFKPDPNIMQEIGSDDGSVVVTIRPPATEAHYFRQESEELFEAIIEYLGNQENVKMIMLPRNERQGTFIRKKWANLFARGVLKIPSKVVDGLNLIWYSDCVVSGGGTMNREAAALGVPVYSIFRGTLGAVDRYLAETGRLTLIESANDISRRLVLRQREKGGSAELLYGPALERIVEAIENIVGKRSVL